MKKIVLLIMFFVMPIIANGYYEITNPDCTANVKTSLRESVSEIIYAMERYKENTTVYYKMFILEIPNNLKVIDKGTDIAYSSDSTIYRVLPGSSKIFKIYANSSSPCDGYNVYTKIIDIPYYNKYSESPLCVGNEQYYLCKEGTKTSVSESEFEALINKYILDNEAIEEPEKEEPIIVKEDNIINKIIDFIYENYVYILLSVIVLGTLGIITILIIKKKKNNF